MTDDGRPTLFDAAPDGDVPPELAIQAVYAFLTRCEAWAEQRELPRRLTAYQTDPSPANAAKLHQWATWRDFIRHASRELQDGTLDHWFVTPDRADR